MAWGLTWLVAVAVVGPPKLPPLPGKDAPPAEPSTPASKPSPTSKPAAKPATPSKPTSKLPSTPTVAPAAEPPSSTPPTTSGDPIVAPPPTAAPGEWSIPEKTEPPQPEPTAPPPKPMRDGPGAAPRMDGKAPEGLPSSDDGDAPKKMPPPLRPPYRGIGLFVGAGVTFAVALSEQIAGHVLVKRRCIDPVARESMMVDDTQAAEELGNAVVRCLPGVVPAIALRVNSDIALLATIGMATAGAMIRAERTAYDHAFANRKQKNIPALRGAGVGLIAGGVITWFTLGPAAWALLSKCGTAKCATRARAMAFITRDVGASMAAAGAGMLGFAESYRRHHERFSRERAIMFTPTFGRGMAGLGMTGKF